MSAPVTVTVTVTVTVPPVTVTARPELAVALLRHFDPAGAFARAVNGACGRPLPGAHEAVQTETGDILAWRSPTETLLLRTTAGGFEDIAAHAAGTTDGCLVDQTGGITPLLAAGPGLDWLMTRLGAGSPAAGRSRISRLADLSVTALCLRPGEIWLLVDRVHADHLCGWIDATLQDAPLQ